jgi:hypothetical protein
MRRRLLFLVIAAAAMVVAPALPAMAQESQEEAADSIVYFPYGNGATYSCEGGAPFVFDSAGTGNCAVQQIGALPPGLVCDIPTTITFVHQGYQWVADARLCQSGTDARNLTTTTTTTTSTTTTYYY